MLVEAGEDQDERKAVHAFAEHTFLQQQKDYLEVKRRAQAGDKSCQEVIKNRPPPTWEECLKLSISIRRKREVDHRDTLPR